MVSGIGGLGAAGCLMWVEKSNQACRILRNPHSEQLEQIKSCNAEAQRTQRRAEEEQEQESWRE